MKKQTDDRMPLAELIDKMKEGVDDAFQNTGYPNIAFVLIAQDADTGFGGLSSNAAGDGVKTLIQTALTQIEKVPLRIIQ